MKKIITLALVFCFISLAYAQTDGLTYQAVIIGPDDLELPGVDVEGNYLPNTTIAIRFTIFDSNNILEFQEIQITETDDFGRVNLLIGDGDHDYFKEMNWDGTPKDLKVEIDFEAGNNFIDMSRERLTFLPYAFHRNITATGTLTVDDRTFLNGELQVEGPTNLNSTLDVNNGNATNLSGILTVEGEATLNGKLTVIDSTRLESALRVIGKTTLNDLQVVGEASFGDLNAETITVNQSTNLNGTTLIDGLGSQVRITSNLPDTGSTIGNHPLLIDGGKNGLAIQVNGSRSNDTNFITFYDQTRGEPWGRIEGETPGEFGNNADYNFDQSSLDYDIFDADMDLVWATVDIAVTAARLIAAGSDFRACFGLGACTVVPGPVDIGFAVAEVLIVVVKEGFAIAAKVRADDNLDLYDENKLEFQGVTYASGAGDYAEYLERSNLHETMTFGDVVGVIGGKISKDTKNAERIMVVSFKPIVLGNMPKPNKENDFEKVAFMGQIPVKVFGKVNIGDYIIPSGKNDGIGKAISPSKIKIEQIKNIIGIAWEESNNIIGLNMVNVAVGLNRNDNNFIVERLEKQLGDQNAQINELKNQISEIVNTIAELKLKQYSEKSVVVNGEENHEIEKGNIGGRDYEMVPTNEGEIVYFEITEKDLELGLKIAENQLRAEGADIDNFDFWKKIKKDSNFKKQIFESLKKKFDKQFHYHKELSLGKRD